MNVNTSDDDDFSNETKREQPLTTRRELWSYYLYYNGVRHWIHQEGIDTRLNRTMAIRCIASCPSSCNTWLIEMDSTLRPQVPVISRRPSSRAMCTGCRPTSRSHPCYSTFKRSRSLFSWSCSPPLVAWQIMVTGIDIF